VRAHRPRLSGTLLRIGILAVLGAVPAAAQRPATHDIVWPPAPEPARVRYVGTVGSEADIGRREGFVSRLWRTLLGGQRTRMVTMQRPFDVLVRDGRLYYTDGATSALTVFDRRARQARILGDDIPGGLAKPMGLAGDAAGRVYVADAQQRRVVVLDAEGRFERAFGGPSMLLNPVDVAVDPAADRYYVVDSYLHQVVVFNGVGTLIQRIGRDLGDRGAKLAGTGPTTSFARDHRSNGDSALMAAHPSRHEGRDLIDNRGEESGAFRNPGCAAVGPDGRLYVSDQMNFRVQVFDRTGAFDRVFGSLGDQPGAFARPKGVAVDRHGNVYVVDAAFNNVQVFDDQGRLLLAFGGIGHGEGEHWLPIGITVTMDDEIYVADRYNNRLQVYRLLADTPREPAAAGGTSGPQE